MLCRTFKMWTGILAKLRLRIQTQQSWPTEHCGAVDRLTRSKATIAEASVIEKGLETTTSSTLFADKPWGTVVCQGARMPLTRGASFAVLGAFTTVKGFTANRCPNFSCRAQLMTPDKRMVCRGVMVPARIRRSRSDALSMLRRVSLIGDCLHPVESSSHQSTSVELEAAGWPWRFSMKGKGTERPC
jgi:hypothetical protein